MVSDIEPPATLISPLITPTLELSIVKLLPGCTTIEFTLFNVIVPVFVSEVVPRLLIPNPPELTSTVPLLTSDPDCKVILVAAVFDMVKEPALLTVSVAPALTYILPPEPVTADEISG